jgi:hypothetical protein
VRVPDSSRRISLKAAAAAVCATAILAVASALPGSAQSTPYQRAFPQPKAIVEKRIKELQSSSSGRLPVLAGFTIPGDRPLVQFHRGYYQCTAQVSSTPSGGTIVRVNAIITAWYAGPVSGKSGYEVLPSNGRLEADFLDRLQNSLGGQESLSSAAPTAHSQAPPPRNQPDAPGSSISAPLPGVGTRSTNAASSPFELAAPMSLSEMPSLATQKAVVDRRAEEQAKEVHGLEEILHNQVRPSNLVAVRKEGTPVLASPNEAAKVLFLADAEDEFEILDVTSNWVHVRISGLSRGWIRRSGLEMLTADSDPQPAETATPSLPAPAEDQPFQVETEEVAPFPGDWESLQGKMVRIVSVQKANQSPAATGAGAKLAFAKSLLARQYADLIKTSSSVAGLVVIFDSEDGGMMAATMSALRQWKAGTLSDQTFWRRCFFDPPEAFGLSASP